MQKHSKQKRRNACCTGPMSLPLGHPHAPSGRHASSCRHACLRMRAEVAPGRQLARRVPAAQARRRGRGPACSQGSRGWGGGGPRMPPGPAGLGGGGARTRRRRGGCRRRATWWCAGPATSRGSRSRSGPRRRGTSTTWRCGPRPGGARRARCRPAPASADGGAGAGSPPRAAAQELIAMQQNGPKDLGFFGTRNMGFLHQNLIEILSYVMVLTARPARRAPAHAPRLPPLRRAARARRTTTSTPRAPRGPTRPSSGARCARRSRTCSPSCCRRAGDGSRPRAASCSSRRAPPAGAAAGAAPGAAAG